MDGIRARNLKMVFDDFVAVADVSFDVAAGEFVTLLGPSGCGKTTLLKMISGFLTPTGGSIHLSGLDVTRTPPEKRDTALCFQSYALFPRLTVLENLEFGLRQKRVAPDERKRRLDAVIGNLDLSLHLTKLPNQLSGGQQQRVALGRALVMRPNVILFDDLGEGRCRIRSYGIGYQDDPAYDELMKFFMQANDSLYETLIQKLEG